MQPASLPRRRFLCTCAWCLEFPELDPRNFHRKVTGMKGFVVDTNKRRAERARPAQVYRVGNLRLLNPPMRRPGLALTT
jgi:hypothetical protein